MMTETTEDKARLLLALRRHGLTDPALLEAMEQTPREQFVSEAFAAHAWRDAALPIDCGQTISQPLIVAMMTAALEPRRDGKVLEIGTGSGYQTAILSRLCRRVYTVERHQALMRQAETRFATLGLTNITCRLGDGSLGWQEQAPFARILIAAAAVDIPPVLAAQLTEGGILVAPVGEADGPQDLLRIVRTASGLDVRKLASVKFVPLVAGVAP